MRKFIASLVATMSILCLTGCESPEQRQHNLDAQPVSNSEEEVVEKPSSGILYASVEGELFENKLSCCKTVFELLSSKSSFFASKLVS